MSEPSPEAVVASEAAANAVEELHSRQEVESLSVAAGETAAVASLEASDARENAMVALDVAIGAGEAAEAATATAEGVRETAEGASDWASQAYHMSEQTRNEVAELRTLFGEFLQRVQPAQPEENSGVNEVDVTEHGSEPKEAGSSGAGRHTDGSAGKRSGGRARRFNR